MTDMRETQVEVGRSQSVTSSPARLTRDHNGNTTSVQKTHGHAQSDRLTVLLASDKFSRVKLALILCCAVFACHTVLVLLVGNTSDADVTAKDVYSQPLNVEKQEVVQPRHVRAKRDVTEYNMERRQSGGETGTCTSGHISGLGPICDNGGCLHKLGKTPANQDSGNVTFQDTVELSGNRRVYHVIIHVLTALQRDSGIYGSVGLLNSHGMPFLEYMTSHVDVVSGERLFTTDGDARVDDLPSFASGRVLSTGLVNGYSMDTNDSPKPVLYQGKEEGLTKAHFSNLEVPQFRFVSVGEGHDVSSTLASLEKAACLLREGGVILVQGVGDVHSQTSLALRQFFQTHNTDSLCPFLVLRNKVFLCTTSWRERLLTVLSSHPSITDHATLRQESNNKFGVFATYFTVGR